MGVIYTAIFGKYDDLKEPAVLTPGWRYICFTDQDLKSDVWEIVKVPVMPCGPSKTARYYKINFHKAVECFFSIWIDATFIINTDLYKWTKRHRYPFTTIEHPFDDCAYKDAQSCLALGKGGVTLKTQIHEYRGLGMPQHAGLISSGILMRNITPEVIEFCEQWWSQVEKYSSRDQVSFTFTHWKNPITKHSIKWDYTKEREFWHVPHLHKKWRVKPTINELQAYQK